MDEKLLSITSKKGKVFLIASFFALTFFTYGTSLNNEFVNFDDNFLIFDNPAVQELSPATVAWVFTHFDPELYIPVTFLSYQLDHLIGGLNPTIFHVHNLILHTLNSLFVVWLIFLLSKRKWLALFCGAIFAVHPLNTETVMWASARKDLISTLFFLLSIITYLNFKNIKKQKWFLISLGLFLLGLLSKVSIVIFPVIILIIDYYQEKKVTRESFISKIPFFALSAIFGVIAIFGKQSVLSDSSFLDSILIAIKSTVFYLQKLFLPTNLSVIYPYTNKITITSPDFFVPIIIITLITLVIYLFRRNKNVLFGFIFFLITLAPSFVNYAKAGVTYFASDRYTYIPSIGILFIVGTAFFYLFGNYKKNATALFAAIIIVFSVLSNSQAKVWANTTSLFENVLIHYENSHLAYNKVGANYLENGDYEQAVKLLKKSIEIKPNARAFYNLSLVYIALSEYDKALELSKKSVELNPNKMDAQYNLGFLYYQANRLYEAIERFEIVINKNPKDIDALTNLAVLNLKIGDRDKAIAYIDKILEIDPDNEDAKKLFKQIN